jgi:glutathione synthase/RimK-type ligase-like ATP-grasp enzyme
MRVRKVAVVTLAEDIHGPVIQYALDQHEGIECHIVHADRVCEKGMLAWSNADARNFASTIVTAGGEQLRVRDVDLVWWRRANYPQKIPSEITDPAEISLITNDCRAALWGIFLTEFKGIWISNPNATLLAENKIVQLAAARRAGFQVPRTLVSNDPKRIRAFCRELRNLVVVKPVRGAFNCQLFARMVRAEHLKSDDALTLSPAIYQEFIPGNQHLRAHCFGDDVYTVSIESEDLDWRENTDVPIRISDCEGNVKSALRNVIRDLGLKMGVVDLKVSHDGIPIWLEINPQGQFLFAEGLSGLDLTGAFARFIAREAKQQRVKAISSPI